MRIKHLLLLALPFFAGLNRAIAGAVGSQGNPTENVNYTGLCAPYYLQQINAGPASFYIQTAAQPLELFDPSAEDNIARMINITGGRVEFCDDFAKIAMRLYRQNKTQCSAVIKLLLDSETYIHIADKDYFDMITVSDNDPKLKSEVYFKHDWLTNSIVILPEGLRIKNAELALLHESFHALFNNFHAKNNYVRPFYGNETDRKAVMRELSQLPLEVDRALKNRLNNNEIQKKFKNMFLNIDIHEYLSTEGVYYSPSQYLLSKDQYKRFSSKKNTMIPIEVDGILYYPKLTVHDVLYENGNYRLTLVFDDPVIHVLTALKVSFKLAEKTAENNFIFEERIAYLYQKLNQRHVEIIAPKTHQMINTIIHSKEYNNKRKRMPIVEYIFSMKYRELAYAIDFVRHNKSRFQMTEEFKYADSVFLTLFEYKYFHLYPMAMELVKELLLGIQHPKMIKRLNNHFEKLNMELSANLEGAFSFPKKKA